MTVRRYYTPGQVGSGQVSERGARGRAAALTLAEGLGGRATAREPTDQTHGTHDAHALM